MKFECDWHDEDLVVRVKVRKSMKTACECNYYGCKRKFDGERNVNDHICKEKKEKQSFMEIDFKNKRGNYYY